MECEIKALKTELAQKNREIEGLRKMADDTQEWMEQDNSDREKLQGENESLKARLDLFSAKFRAGEAENSRLKKEKAELERQLLEDQNSSG